MIDVELKDGVIDSVKFTGGCNGNLQGISALVKGMKPEEAITFIQQNRGKRYCPQVVDAFLEIMGTSDPVALAGHEIGTNALRPGMVLARDLVGKDGVMLLAADFVLDENLIRQLRELEASEGSRLTVAIRPPQGA